MSLDTFPIDASELRPCALCRQPLLHGGNIIFYEIAIGSCVIDLREVQRLASMETMMGNVAIARAMAPSTTVGRRVSPTKHFICMECSQEPVMPIQLMEEG